MLFRTPTIRTKPQRVEREGGDYGAGAIFGIKVAQKGEAKGHGVHLDDTTLDQIIAQGNAAASGKKSRFTHPNASSDGLGTSLGKFKNFRRDGDADYADLHFFKSAHSSPKGNLAGYTMDLAEESPEDFGSSISFEWEGEPKKGAPVRLKSLRAVDIVDSPAATDGLFSSEPFSGDDPARHATALLDTFFADTPAAELRGRVDNFLQTYFQTKGQPMPNPAANPTSPAAPPANPPDAQHGTPPTAANPPADPPSALSAADVDKRIADKVAEAQAAERTRCSQIRALCDQAKRPQLAGRFIGEGTTVAEAQSALFKALCEDNPTVGDTGAGDQLAEKKDPDAEFKKEWAALSSQQRAALAAQGCDEAGYVQTRRIDDGLDPISVLIKKPA